MRLYELVACTPTAHQKIQRGQQRLPAGAAERTLYCWVLSSLTSRRATHRANDQPGRQHEFDGGKSPQQLHHRNGIFLPTAISRRCFTTLPQYLAIAMTMTSGGLVSFYFFWVMASQRFPSVLHSGSVAVLKLFDIPTLFDLSYASALSATVVIIELPERFMRCLAGLKPLPCRIP